MFSLWENVCILMQFLIMVVKLLWFPIFFNQFWKHIFLRTCLFHFHFRKLFIISFNIHVISVVSIIIFSLLFLRLFIFAFSSFFPWTLLAENAINLFKETASGFVDLYFCLFFNFLNFHLSQYFFSSIYFRFILLFFI